LSVPPDRRPQRTPEATAADERARQARQLYEAQRIQAQRRYYDARSREYSRAREQAVTVSSVLLAAATVTGICATFANGTARALWGVAGAMLAALAAAVTAYESLMSFGQLAKLYADAAANLQHASAGWSTEPAWSAARLGRRVDGVERIFRLESGQWGQLALSAYAGLAPADGPDDGDEDGDEPPAGDARLP
jgi:ABC-type multidrug transport system fused ATPase/permease subunit